MTSPRWWICPDDPEAGTIDADDGEVELQPFCVDGGPWRYFAFDVDNNAIGEVIPAPCSICEGPVPPKASHPLCSFHGALGCVQAEHARFYREHAGEDERRG